MLDWQRIGKIFDPTEHHTDWMYNYSQNPNVVELHDRLRVYFTCRPKRDNLGSCVSYTAFADFEKSSPFKLIKVAEKPILPLGGPGDFDEFGIMPGSIIRSTDGYLFLYYVGWTRMVSVPYKWSIGLAISHDNGETFQKLGKGPIISTSLDDPYLQACPRVVQVDDGYLMYYQCGLEWNSYEDHLESVYVTRVATSKNGIDWVKGKANVLPSIVEKECQTSSSFIQFNGINHMFFSYRHGLDFRNKQKGYRIGYAQSNNYEDWVRADEKLNLALSNTGWDSEMMCYPNVLEIGKDIYMFYCGNNFGQNGFGALKLLR